MLHFPQIKYSYAFLHKFLPTYRFLEFPVSLSTQLRKKHSQAKFNKNIETLPEKKLPIIIQTDNVPIYLYTNKIERQARKQLIQLAKSPLPVGHIAAMPDVHLGKGTSIGTVLASKHAVCPNTVGVDIGCGMTAIRFPNLTKNDLSLRQKNDIQKIIKEKIPTGFNSHRHALPNAKHVLLRLREKYKTSPWMGRQLGVRKKHNKIKRQIGTLGGGNHFLEVLYENTSTENIWLMLHSGSRKIGNITARYHQRIAIDQCSRRDKNIARGLAYLMTESITGQHYLNDMRWCQQYAYENRKAMMELMCEVMHIVTEKTPDPDSLINIHHNFCSCETCTYQNSSGEWVTEDLWVTRKGATAAKEGQLGIIPGSMGTGSYIVRGLGNPESWESCSHGAGRQMSRTQAKKKISQREFERSMKGIVCDSDGRVRDEAPGAYKNLDDVMENQKDLIEVVVKLNPLINVKGF